MFISELLYRKKDSTKVAIQYGKEKITYNSWYQRSVSLSERIHSVNSAGNRNILIFVPNSIDYAVGYFGILFAKGVVVPLGVNSSEAEMVSVLKYCEINTIVTNSEYKNSCFQVLEKYNQRANVVLTDCDDITIVHEEKEPILAENPTEFNDDEHDVAIMLHTSGTMSDPKRVMLTHFNIINNIESNIDSLKLNSDDRVLISMPMHFGYCNTAQFLTHLYLGAEIFILEKTFFPKSFLQLVQDHKITNFTCVPTMLLLLLQFPNIGNYDVSSLRYICFGGSKMPVDKLKKIMKVFPHTTFVQTYGQTEASPRVTALLGDEALRKIGSVGKPISKVEVRIVDENDCELSLEQEGEIVVKGPNVMKGYYKQEEKTKETLKNGWLHTGDIGRLDSEGYLYLTGRKKNMIIVGGINVYPEEIEEILMEHPDVKEAHVFGREDELFGEVPIAEIVLSDTEKFSAAELKKYCKEILTDIKVPKQFIVVECLLKTYNGKIKR